MKFKHSTFAVMAALFGLSEAQADVLCATKAGALSVRGSCKATEKVVSPSSIGAQGPAGPAGPAGAQGPSGAQGPAGIGITNAACAQADITGSPWIINFVDTSNSNLYDQCGVAFDTTGNIVSGSFCLQTVGTAPVAQLQISQGSLKLSSDTACEYNLQLVLTSGPTWRGVLNVDRSRSTMLGLSGIAVNATQTRNVTTTTGVRLGAISSAKVFPQQLIEEKLYNQIKPFGLQ